QPFILMVSFPDPHHPFTPPGKYWDMYDPDDMPLPANFGGMSDGTPLYEFFRNRRPEPGTFRGALEGVDEREAKEAMALTAGMMAMIDDAVGDVRTAIDSSASGDHTVQMYTSDHGDMMGDHGLLLKGPVNLDGVLKVPFLWSDPQQESVATSDALVSTIDIGATVLARAGVEGFNGIQGVDLAPTLDSNEIPREQLLVEHDAHVVMPITGDDWPPRIRTLVTPEWKMSVYLDQDWGELFNRTDDPLEMRNLWADSSAKDAKAELTWLLSQELIRTVDRSPLPIAMG
ncbi:MAG: sulfatase, partial [Acidimicrobiales bacterium]